MQKIIVAAALLAFLAVAVEAQAPNAATAANNARGGACTVTIQYDNDLNEVSKGKANEKILQVLADQVFLLKPGGQVKQVSALSQSGVVSSQSVITYSATGVTTNGKTPCDNCKANTQRRAVGLQNSVLESEIQKATNTWLPNDKVDVQKATCTAA